MPAEREILKNVIDIYIYCRGLVCPSELWNCLFAGLDPDEVNDFLNQAPAQHRKMLLGEYHGLARYRFQETAVSASDRHETILAFQH